MPNGGTHEEYESFYRSRFLSDFAAVDQHLRRLAGADPHVSWREVVDQASAKDPTVQRHQPDLMQFADIRDAVLRWQEAPLPRPAQPRQEHVVSESTMMALQEIRTLLTGRGRG
jgi:hypothetical protein